MDTGSDGGSPDDDAALPLSPISDMDQDGSTHATTASAPTSPTVAVPAEQPADRTVTPEE